MAHLARGERSGCISWQRQWGRARLQGDGLRRLRCQRMEEPLSGRVGAGKTAGRRPQAGVQGSGRCAVAAADGQKRRPRPGRSGSAVGDAKQAKQGQGNGQARPEREGTGRGLTLVVSFTVTCS
nr:uncharacterized protein LOC123493809 isoform X1 [Aegilops tauschii subsp. strangulata]